MRKKFESFKADLIDLCRKHRVVISTTGYDAISVRDADTDRQEEAEFPIHADYIEDNTVQD